MFNRDRIRQFKPTVLYFIIYTAVFFLFTVTFSYTFPFLAGFLLALMVQPLVRFLTVKLNFKQGLASALATFLVFLIVFGIIALTGAWLIMEITNLINVLRNFLDKADSSFINNAVNQITSYLSKFDTTYITENKQQIFSLAQTGATVLTSLLGGILSFLTSIPTIFTMFIVMIFSTYFFSQDIPKLKRQLLSPFSHNAVLSINAASRHGFSMSGKYVLSYLLIYFITFVETLIVFLILGIPYPLVLSILTGFADVLPVLGPGTIYIPLAIFELFKGKVVTAVALIIAWLVITMIRQVIEPKIVSASINVHPLCMLAAIYFALVSGNFVVLIYLTLLFVLYQILVKVEVLPPIFPSEEPEIKPDEPPEKVV